MLQRLISALTTKAAIALAAVTLTAGAAATAAPVLVSDSQQDNRSAVADEHAQNGEHGTPATPEASATLSVEVADEDAATENAADQAAKAAARCEDDDERSNHGLDSHDNEAWDDDGDKKCAEDGGTAGAAPTTLTEEDDDSDDEGEGHGRGGVADEHRNEHADDDDDDDGNRGHGDDED